MAIPKIEGSQRNFAARETCRTLALTPHLSCSFRPFFRFRFLLFLLLKLFLLFPAPPELVELVGFGHVPSLITDRRTAPRTGRVRRP
jgi:hypothetical protein